MAKSLMQQAHLPLKWARDGDRPHRGRRSVVACWNKQCRERHLVVGRLGGCGHTSGVNEVGLREVVGASPRTTLSVI